MRIAQVFRKAAILALLALFASSSAFAGTTGKISGKIVDAKTKDAVPFATIQIDDTRMGAQADVNGEYVIINVPPGKYNVTATLAGYRPVKTEDVEILVDRTTTVNFTMEQTVVEMEAQVVAHK